MLLKGDRSELDMQIDVTVKDGVCGKNMERGAKDPVWKTPNI